MNTELINNYLTTNKEVINMLLTPDKGLKMIKKLEISVSEVEDILEGEVKKRILKTIDNL